MSDFRISTQQISENVVSIIVRGFLGSETSPEIVARGDPVATLQTRLRREEAINKYCEQGIYRFIVNLSNLRCISARSIAAFLKALDQVREHEGDIVLFQPTADVREEFDIIFGPTEIIKIRPDRASALKAVA